MKKNKDKRCLLTGKITDGKEVIIANELLNFIEKQGTNFIIFKDGELEIKKIKSTNLNNNVVNI